MSARPRAFMLFLLLPGAAFAAPSADPSLTPDFGSPAAAAPEDGLSLPREPRGADSRPRSAPLVVPGLNNPPEKERRSETSKSAEDFAFVKASAGLWLTSAMDRWQTSFALDSAIPKSLLAFGSTLEYSEPRDPMALYSAEIRPFRYFSVEVHYADSGSLSGHVNDHDWLYGPGYIVTAIPSGNVYTAPQYTDMSLSQSQLSGRSTYFAGSAYVRVFIHDGTDSGPWDFSQLLDVGLGYFFYDDRFRMTNTVQIISTGDFISTPPPGPLTGVDSTFHFHYEGATLNLRETTGFTHSLRAVGAFSWSPFVSYHGYGYWNLRTDLAPQSPNFVQWAEGNFMEGRLGLSWEIGRYLNLEADYLLTYAWIKPGTIEALNADGTTTSQGLDSAWSERKGWAFTGAVKF